ncbi:UDP-glucose dehydrogenase family protein [Porphyromonas levii]|uniref:UDP-glucose 6-dehydrogenase n=1 Tax=Porphyromonas levii TaxID=28114 RepID=A0A4Y8WQ14_9PORP|nr:UDP-glucose/GDP-mannose dehydrogenase family protein [Porphyromonas levii]MBR8703314.1 UDP-glucose 6-dehydrogenase TuaD [Porphyromonas levii]MBR8713586.1 UDP-glucose 6-dehydrogenase TuaD [Porphyromonas levii]MBR8715674.1 UDP-glucose 6-dehydrogenase TuaD [Porphyromonas levii]MBR8728187.1 UDP-glucose 6-dehydrogenase TuaD [Porphyromonas levii]MBR8730464.1 UDP-glucose 6-dehydrogenase TuaD [Porphyromonas levii]
MNIAIVGTGYVGLVSGTCFAEMGVRVYCVDTNTEKVEALRRGVIPIYEPGLEELVLKNTEEGRLSFHTSLPEVINQVEMLFIAVGTPTGEEGQADLKYVYEVAREIGATANRHLLVVTKSTVPVGTTDRVEAIIREGYKVRGLEELPLDMANNPEFLKEGAAIKDFMSPDRVVVGYKSAYAEELMGKLYRPFLLNNYRVIGMDIRSSELTKYASNAMLATRISFMNELANLAEALGADISLVREGMGSDKRIGKAFLYPGCGYGGSCFPKDVQALASTGREHGVTMTIIEGVHRANERQKLRPFDKLKAYLGDLKGRKIAIWGLAFKPETDDMRQAPAIEVIAHLVLEGAEVYAFDPIAMENAERILPQSVKYGTNIYDVVEGADAVVLLTEWKQFRLPNWSKVKELMRGNLVVDGRNIYQPSELEALGFRYTGIGRK